MHARLIAVLIFAGQFMIATPVWSDQASDTLINDAIEKSLRESQAEYRTYFMRNMQLQEILRWMPSLQNQLNAKLDRQIARRLQKQLGAGKQAIVSMMSSPSGDLLAPEIKVSSGNNQTDQLALNAVRSASPFLPPPSQMLSGENAIYTCIRLRTLNQHLEVTAYANYPSAWLVKPSIYSVDTPTPSEDL